MENMELNKKMKGLTVAQNKTVNHIKGCNYALAYRGTVTLFSTAVLTASATALVKVAPHIQNIIMNESAATSAMAVLGMSGAMALIPVSLKVIKWETSFIKSHIRDKETCKNHFARLNDQIIETENEIEKTKTLK